MRIVLLCIISIVLLSCTASQDAIEAECKQGIGEACNKIGNHKRACDLGNTNGCVNLAETIKKTDFDEARRVLKFSCDKGNSTACVKLTELLQSTLQK